MHICISYAVASSRALIVFTRYYSWHIIAFTHLYSYSVVRLPDIWLYFSWFCIHILVILPRSMLIDYPSYWLHLFWIFLEYLCLFMTLLPQNLYFCSRFFSDMRWYFYISLAPHNHLWLGICFSILASSGLAAGHAAPPDLCWTFATRLLSPLHGHSLASPPRSLASTAILHFLSSFLNILASPLTADLAGYLIVLWNI